MSGSGNESVELGSLDHDNDSIKSTQALAEVNHDELDSLNKNALIQEDQFNQQNNEQEQNPNLYKFMTACQQGNLPVVKDLIENRVVGANDSFSDSITGLHWAAINNRLSLVKYLVDNDISPCKIDAFGGELEATPLHWACRNGLVYIVSYLIEQGANPALKDNQQYNALHLSVHSSNIMLIIYILYKCCGGLFPGKEIYVDEPDNSNRTSLHWACYQGDILTIQALLKFGADVSKQDTSLFIPLHWSFMKSYKPIFTLLIDHGSDIYFKNDHNKDSFDIAKDMNCYNLWIKALKECRRSEKYNWEKRPPMINPQYGKLATFLWPYVILPIMFLILDFTNGFIIPKLFGGVVFLLSSIIILNKFIIPIFLIDDKALTKTPFLAGVFSGTFFWVIVVYTYNVLPPLIFRGFISFISNLVFIGLICIIGYTFTKAMFLNPGLVPTFADNSKTYEQIVTLLDLGKYDADHFCINSYIRKPLRSKYSFYNKRLIARFDHYCPWVYNEIGVRNHKVFMWFVYSLNIGVILFIFLSLDFFDIGEDGYDSEFDEKCALLNDELCLSSYQHTFHFNLIIWSGFQTIWVTILSLSQTFQIIKGITTREFSIMNSAGKLGYNHSTLPAELIRSKPSTNKQKSQANTCLKLLGLDQLGMTIKMAVYTLLKRPMDNDDNFNTLDIPTDYGIKQNWLDFWFLGETKIRNIFYLPIEGENNLNGQLVDYYTLYEYPSKLSIPNMT